MNDRLTFRFFNTKANKYMSDQYVDETTVFLLARLGGDKYIIEQCTGLKDKNGQLIYEGDIIASRFQGELFTANIKYFRAGWVAEFHNWKPSLYQMCNEAKIEVVGNIHENPELLEDK